MPDLLDPYELGAELLAHPPAPDPFDDPYPVDADTANRMLRRSARIEADVAWAQDLHETELAKLAAWHADAIAGPLARAAHLRSLVCGWFASARADGDTRKSVKLPAGTVTTVATGTPRVIVDDDRAAIAWFRANGLDSLVRVVETVDVPAVRACPDLIAVTPPPTDRDHEHVSPVASATTGELAPITYVWAARTYRASPS